MANYRMNKLQIGANTYECAEWYGVCSTAANTQAKIVTISGFTSAQLVEGCKVTVRFQYAQNYNGAPTLNVSSTGAKTIQSVSGTSAGRYEWSAGQIVAFVYYNGYWVIEDGTHASASRYGKAILTNNWKDNGSGGLAASPSAIQGAFNDIVVDSVWTAGESVHTLVSTQTPSAAGWTVIGNEATCTLTVTDPSDYLANTVYKARVVEISFGEHVAYLAISPEETIFSLYFSDVEFTIDAHQENITINIPSTDIGEHDLTVQLYYGYLFMTYPLMDYYLKDNGYLTLADLPIWDGSVT